VLVRPISRDNNNDDDNNNNNNNNNNNGLGRNGGPSDQEEPPSVAEDPTPEAKKTCLRDDDVFIDYVDSYSMYSDEENTTELIQNGIKHIGDGNIDEDTDDVDVFVDEVVTIVAIKLKEDEIQTVVD
jgi:hypothetical protein